MTMSATAAAVWFLALLSISSATNFMKCTSWWLDKFGTPPLNTTLSNCENFPCDLVRGTNISGSVEFVYDKNITMLKPQITTYILGIIPIIWNTNQKDGCESLALKCPILAGTRARYEYSFFLDPKIPLFHTLLRLEFKDARGATTICAEIPIRIVPNPSQSNHGQLEI